MGFDRHLFLLDGDKLDLSDLTSFHKSVLKSWTLFRASRELSDTHFQWLKEEPLFFNPALELDIFKSPLLRNAALSANITKVGHLASEDGWLSAETLALKLGIRSVQVVQRLLTEVQDRLPQNYSVSLVEPGGEEVLSFPDLEVSAENGEWQEAEGNILSFTSLQSGLFSTVGKKQLYVMCVKALHCHTLESVKESKWLDFFGSGSSPKGSWRTLYKPPIDKRSGDLQWRIVHGIIATNRHRAHIDPQVGEGCPFCGQLETVFHLFSECERLVPLFCFLEECCRKLGEVFTKVSFIYGPKYKLSKRETHVLVNFVFGQAKLAIWLSRKNKIVGMGQTDVTLIFRGLIKSRLKVEFAFYNLIMDIETFKYRWGINNCICEVDCDGSLNIYV